MMNKEPSMLDDLLATDAKLEQDEVNQSQPLQLALPEDGDFIPLDLRHLSAEDFSVVVAGVMKRLDTEDMIFTQEELSGLDAPEGLMSVLACTYSPSTGSVRFRIFTAPKSEFRQ